MRFKVVIASFLLSVGYFSHTQLAYGETTQVQQLRTLLQQVETLTGRFEQRLYEFDEPVEQLTGSFALQRPHLLYWETEVPEESILVADGDSVWYFNPFIEQVSIFTQADTMAANPLLVLLDDSEWEHFNIRKADRSDSSREGSHWVIEGREDGQVLELAFNAESKLYRMSLTDSFGQRSEFRLYDTIYNEVIAPERFRFIIPEGVDVDDQR